MQLGDLGKSPDFVALSFYKIFGFPDLGALLVQKNASHALQHRRYFGGGTVEMVVSVGHVWHAKKDGSVHERLEDGTPPFHSIVALDHAIRAHERLYGSDPMELISRRTARLSKKMYEGLVGLRHGTGSPVVRFYPEEDTAWGNPLLQGPTIALNVLRGDGTLVGYKEFETAASLRKIYVRSGSLCNPGGVATYLEWSASEMMEAYRSGHRCSRPMQAINDKATGVVRVSLGAMSTFGDVAAFLTFVKEVYLEA